MNDFDFLTGSWTVSNRRLKTLLAGADDWETFPGSATCRPIFDGGGTTEEIVFPTLPSRGLSVRLFDVERQRWSIYWSSSRTGLLYPPVHGTFAGGRGDFYGDDTHDGKPIKAHFIWSEITPTSARWEQEFSADGGETWETNWIMEYVRV
ncbi:hypothetical protein AB0M36_34365 [Actinoplanes sp. NPDC051346]|uniref:hypothetical protein n=1 Tax=Actinoplanes sp. NPDC051346 TaxID=3155048 RepID=UPI003433525F